MRGFPPGIYVRETQPHERLDGPPAGDFMSNWTPPEPRQIVRFGAWLWHQLTRERRYYEQPLGLFEEER